MPGGSYNAGIGGAESFEHGGSFGLHWIPRHSSGGELGNGDYPREYLFRTEGERTYFIQAEQLRERCTELENELWFVQEKLRRIEEKREKRRRARLEKSGKC